MVDPKKTYRTRDFREVRIYATDGTKHGQIHDAWYSVLFKGWVPTSWFEDGRWFEGVTGPKDLIEAP